jgi:small-conductance mechanosensitive channel
MSSADTVARIFDQARDVTLSMADELRAARQTNAQLNDLVSSHEVTIESLRRSQELAGRQIDDLTEKNRKLERLNAVFHSRADLIVEIIKQDGGELLANSDLRPEQLLNPRKAGDDDNTDRLLELQDALERLRPDRGYVSQMTGEISHTAERSGLADAAANSSEAEPR